MAVGAAESLVNVQQALDPVLAGIDVIQAGPRVAEHRGVEVGSFAGCEILDVDSEYLLRPGAVVYLKARLAIVVARDQQQHPAVEARVRRFTRKGNFEPKPARAGRYG